MAGVIFIGLGACAATSDDYYNEWRPVFVVCGVCIETDFHVPVAGREGLDKPADPERSAAVRTAIDRAMGPR